MNLFVTPIDPTVDARWDAFVASQAQASVYHHSSWVKVIRATYGHETICLTLQDDRNTISGVIPFVLIKSRITGSRIVSLPFATYCNPILPNDAFAKVLDFLLERYEDIDYIELKVVENDAGRPPKGFVRRSEYVTHILSLEPPLEDLLMSFHSTSVRQRVRKGEKKNFKVKLAESEEDLKQFYKLHTVVRKKHGLPPHPYSFFFHLWHELRPRQMVYAPLVLSNDQVAAAAFILRFKETFYFEQSATSTDYLKDCANQVLIWESIKLARSLGGRYFDFGRSARDNLPLIEFKKRWNAQGVPLSSYFYPECPRRNSEASMSRKILGRINHLLPNTMLQLEGRLLYPHLG